MRGQGLKATGQFKEMYASLRADWFTALKTLIQMLKVCVCACACVWISPRRPRRPAARRTPRGNAGGRSLCSAHPQAPLPGPRVLPAVPPRRRRCPKPEQKPQGLSCSGPFWGDRGVGAPPAAPPHLGGGPARSQEEDAFPSARAHSLSWPILIGD